eukprot:1359316-Pleurochrysis_carterae.AAC.1
MSSYPFKISCGEHPRPTFAGVLCTAILYSSCVSKSNTRNSLQTSSRGRRAGTDPTWEVFCSNLPRIRTSSRFRVDSTCDKARPIVMSCPARRTQVGALVKLERTHRGHSTRRRLSGTERSVKPATRWPISPGRRDGPAHRIGRGGHVAKLRRVVTAPCEYLPCAVDVPGYISTERMSSTLYVYDRSYNASGPIRHLRTSKHASCDALRRTY